MSLDQGHLPNVTLGNHTMMQQAQQMDPGQSPKMGMNPNGILSPGKGRTMKEYDQQISLLKKENFSLKMRIFYMEDRMQEQYGGSQDVFKTNIELRVQAETLKKDLAEKQLVIQRASHALEVLTSNQQQVQESIQQKCDTDYQEIMENLKVQVEKSEKECDKYRQEAQAANDLVVELEAGLKATNQAKKDMTQKFENAKFEIQSLTGQLKLSQQSVKDANLEKDGALSRAKKLEKQLQDTNQQLARKDRDIQNLSAAFDHPMPTDHPASLDVVHLQDKCQDQMEEIEGYLKKIADLEFQLKDKEHEFQVLKDKLNARDSDLKSTDQRLEQQKNDMEDKNNQLARYKRSMESFFHKLVEKEKQATSMTDTMIKLKEQTSEQQKKLNILESEKEQSILVMRESLAESTESKRAKHRAATELSETKEQMEDVIQCLGRREGELSRFQEQLRTAMEALTQSESAVEELQAQLRTERAEYDSKLRQQALQFQLSLSFNQDNDDEMAALKQKVKDLQNLIADQNVVNLAMGREKVELEKSVAQLNTRNETIEALKSDHCAEVQVLQREIEALKLEASWIEMTKEAIQSHPLVVESTRRETISQSYITTGNVSKAVNLADVETMWLDLLEDLKKTLNLLRSQVQSKNLQSLAGDSNTADLLVSEIKSIQRVYQQLEKGVEKNSQLHETLLHSLRETRLIDSLDSSSCQDGGPSAAPNVGDSVRDDVDSSSSSLPPMKNGASFSQISTYAFPSITEQKDNTSAVQTFPHIDTDELVNRYLQSSSTGTSPCNLLQRSLPTPTNIPARGPNTTDRSLQISSPFDHRPLYHSMQTPHHDDRSPSPSPLVRGDQTANNYSSQDCAGRNQSVTVSPRSKGELLLSHLAGSLQDNSFERPLSKINNGHQQYSPLSPSSSANYLYNDCAFPSELVSESRGRRVTFDLGLTDDAKEGHLKKSSIRPGACVDTDRDDSLMEVTFVDSFICATADEDKRQHVGQLDASTVSRESDGSSVNDSTLRDETLPCRGSIIENNDEDERGGHSQQESYRVAENTDTSTAAVGGKSSLSPGQQQQLQRQHQQVIASMSSLELRDLLAQLQQDLIESVRQNHGLRDEVVGLKKMSTVNEDQIAKVQDKLHATENTVRYQSIRIKSYKSALDKAGLSGSGTLSAPLSDRSAMSVERARSCQPFQHSLALSRHDGAGMLEGSLTDILSRDGSPSHSLASASSLSLVTKRASSSMPSDLCFVGASHQTSYDLASPGRRATNHSSSPEGRSTSSGLISEHQRPSTTSSNRSDTMVTSSSSAAPFPSDTADDTSFSAMDPSYTSLIDTTLFNKRLSCLDRTTSYADTTINVDKLHARVRQLEQMNAALKEEIQLVNDLCSSMGIELDLRSEKSSDKGGIHTNITTRDELLRKHLIEIRQLRKRLERLDLGNDSEQHLIFQTHIHQRIQHQESLNVQLQKQLEEREEKWHREMAETQHRLQREKCSEVEKVETAAKKELESQAARLKEQVEQIQQLQEKCSDLEQKEMELSRLREEKQETQQDLVKRELEILDMEKMLFSLEMVKEGLDKKVRQLETENAEKEEEIESLQGQVKDHKESCRVMRDTLLKREETLRECEFTVQMMNQERSKFDQKIRNVESELSVLGQREEETKEELKMSREKKRELEIRLVDAEESSKRKHESIYQANRQMGSLRDKVEAAEKNMRSCQEDLRSCQEDLRSSRENVRSYQEKLKSGQEEAKVRDQKLQKRDKQLHHLINQYKKLDVAFTKLQCKLEEKTVTVTSLKRITHLYEAAQKQGASEDLTQSLLQELMATKKQVADLVGRLEVKSNTQQPTVCMKTFGSTVLTSSTDSTDNMGVTPDATSGFGAGISYSLSTAPSDVDQAYDQLSASMIERLAQDRRSSDEMSSTSSSVPDDPVLKEQNENLRKELTRLQSKYDVLDHKVKEQGSRLQASSVRQKDWEKSLCRQLMKTTRELGQAKENIDCTKKLLLPTAQPTQSGSRDSDVSQS